MPYALQTFASLPSTNAYVEENADTLAHGDVIVAQRQTNGRGLLDRSWISGEDGLYFTITLRPAHLTHCADMTQLLALCICQVLEEAGVAAKVKWPNDILVNGVKIAGVLSETVSRNGRIALLALGAGINVGQRALHAPGKAVTSLVLEGVCVAGKNFLDPVLRRFFMAYEAVLAKGFPVIREAYMERLAVPDDARRLEAGIEKIHETFLRLPDTGKRIPGSKSGSAHKFSAGDMR